MDMDHVGIVAPCVQNAEECVQECFQSFYARRGDVAQSHSAVSAGRVVGKISLSPCNGHVTAQCLQAGIQFAAVRFHSALYIGDAPRSGHIYLYPFHRPFLMLNTGLSPKSERALLVKAQRAGTEI